MAPPVILSRPNDAAHARAPAGVVDAVREASKRSGVDFSYLMRQASQESGFRSDARSGSSSAAGLFQFIERTWLQLVKEHGAKYGLGKLAAGVESGPGGPQVASAELKQRILNLRFDPKLSSAMAAEFARANQDRLEQALGAPAGPTELYFAHFLGPAGAVKFLSGLRDDPSQTAAKILPSAAAANRAVFYDRASGRALSVGEVYDRFAARMADDAAEKAAPKGEAATRTASVSDSPLTAGLPADVAASLQAGRKLSPVTMAALASLNDTLSETGYHAPRDRGRDI